MVTLIKYGVLSGGEKYNVNVLELDGLSTDTKPTVTFIEYGSDGREVGRMGIPNGSTYDEVDTGKKFTYDAENATWYETTSGGGGGGGFTPTQAQLAAMNSGITAEKLQADENNISSEQAKTTGMTAGSTDYITVNGIRVYVSATAPTDARTGDLWIGG